MKKIIFRQFVKNFFEERSLRSDEKKFFDEICQKDGFFHFWGKFRF